MFQSIAEALSFVREHHIHTIDFKVADLAGRWRHASLPASRCDAALLTGGVPVHPDLVGLDPSAGAVLALPDVSAGFSDPFWEAPCLSFPCSVARSADADADAVADAVAPHPLDTRATLTRVAAALAEGPAAAVEIECELEFYVFAGVRHSNRGQLAFHALESAESESVLLEGPPAAHGHSILPGAGGGAAPPQDRFRDLRCEIVAELAAANVPVHRHEHGRGAAGHQRIVLAPLGPLAAADATVKAKYFAKNTAARHGLVATFMPQPIHGEAGSELLLRLLLKDSPEAPPLSAPQTPHGLAPHGWSCVGGILEHLPGMVALLAPSTSSHRRLAAQGALAQRAVCGGDGRWAPVALSRRPWATEAAAEVRLGDASANPYLAVAALLAACADGLERGLDPRAEGRCPYPGPPAPLDLLTLLPSSPEAALEALQVDHGYLVRHGALDPSVVTAYVLHKLAHEVRPLRLRPHPYEMALYLDC